MAINGFGRIGRAFFRLSLADPHVQVVAINDRVAIHSLAYLLKHDSFHGSCPYDVAINDGNLVVGAHSIQVCQQERVRRLPWRKLKVDVVIEATGAIRSYETARKHLSAKAKKVVITSIPRHEPRHAIPMFIFGVNEDQYRGERIISASSCSANCAGPVVKVLHEAFTIQRAALTAVHAYTMDQRLLDSAHGGDVRRGRAAALNIVLSASEAARVLGQLIPDLTGCMMGSTIRVPTADGSLINVACQVEKTVDATTVNSILRRSAAAENRGFLAYTEEPLVSRDIVNTTESAIVDGLLTEVVSPSLVRVVAWFDHEWGYASRLVDLVKYIEAYESQE